MASERVLICPLDWGLGHATRCIPLINRLIKENKEVIICADGLSGNLLRQEFPQLTFEKLKGLEIKYSSTLPFFVNVVLKSPALMRSIKNEHAAINQLVNKYNPEMIVSDNRYGVYHSSVKSILVSHQIFPIVPALLKPAVYYKLKSFYKSFNEIWIPDYEGENNLSGALSHGVNLPANCRYIGPLSRFDKPCESFEIYEWEWIGIISGPEPYRTQLYNQLRKYFTQLGAKCALVGGNPGTIKSAFEGNLYEYSHLTTSEMRDHICKAKNIVARSGYSSIMDFKALNRKVNMLPTPGQSEQEYLAKYLKGNEHFNMIGNQDLHEIIFHS